MFGTGATVTYSYMAGGIDCSVGSSVPAPCTTVSLETFLPAGYKNEIQRAFDTWSSVANLTFVEITDQSEPSNSSQLSGDIRIGANNIDGSGSTLAYAFFPYNNTGFGVGGDIQFDSTEPWSLGPTATTFDVFLVALHEIGHSLGLDHELSQLAIMNPYYDDTLTGLTADDIAGIQAIYGPAVHPVPAPDTIFLMMIASLLLVGTNYASKKARR